MSTRRLLEASWAASQRRAGVVGALQATAASCAGQLLEAAKGDARAARDAVPLGTGDVSAFYARVRQHLSSVIDEEADEETSRKTGS